ncbi:MAG: DUF6142 family protein [Lachnospiraceae bacterium]|nr:DUF6142 family protein [Lachnospiraceae bacterium]
MNPKKRRKKEGLHLTDKKHPKQGIWSTVLGIVSVVFFLVLCFMSGETGGKAGVWIGILGVLCAVISIWGFVLAMLSLKMDNIRQLFPSLGVVINGIMIVFYLVIYIMGTA